MNQLNSSKLRAKYKYSSPPSLDVMIIGPEGLTGGYGEQDEILPEIDWTTTPEGKFLFAEIHDWSERPLEEKRKSVEHISKVMGWDLSPSIPCQTGGRG